MTRREGEGEDGTPSADEVEHDFSVPADADLRSAEDGGASTTEETE